MAFPKTIPVLIICAVIFNHYMAQALPTVYPPHTPEPSLFAVTAEPQTATASTARIADDHQHTTVRQICVNVSNAEGESCTVCYDAACKIPDDVFALFGATALRDSPVANKSEQAKTEPAKVCPPVTSPSGDPGPGCAYVASIAPNGCVQCYSRFCLACAANAISNAGVSNVIADAPGVPNMAYQKHRAAGMADFSHVSKHDHFMVSGEPTNCSPTTPPANDVPIRSMDECGYVPHVDSNGCIRYYAYVCPLNTTAPGSHMHATTTPKPRSVGCPLVKPPVEQALAGCVYAKALDANGCVKAYDMICSIENRKHTKKPSLSFYDNGKEKHSKNVTLPQNKTTVTDWKTMLGFEYNKSAHAVEAEKFRGNASRPIITSGRFVHCQLQSDCFAYREPGEWCAEFSVEKYRWTDKSCFCAEDTETRSCVVERVNLQTQAIEWTFCALRSNFRCE